jgi:hypothetical protein
LNRRFLDRLARRSNFLNRDPLTDDPDVLFCFVTNFINIFIIDLFDYLCKFFQPTLLSLLLLRHCHRESMPPKAKTSSKKPPSRARKPSTKALAAKEAASEEEIPAPRKKNVPTKGKTPRKKREMESADSGDQGEVRGGNDDEGGDDADDKVE